MIQLISRITKLSWMGTIDSHFAFRNVVEELKKFLQVCSNCWHYFLIKGLNNRHVECELGVHFLKYFQYVVWSSNRDGVVDCQFPVACYLHREMLVIVLDNDSPSIS